MTNTVRRISRPALTLLLALVFFAAGCAVGPEPKPPRPPGAVAGEKIPGPTVPAPCPQVESPPERGYAALPEEAVRDFSRSLTLPAQGLGSFNDLREPLLDCLAYVEARPPMEIALSHGGLSLTWEEMAVTLRHLLLLLPRLDAEPELLARHFTWMQMAPNPLMTGYYAPEIEASLEKSPGYAYPLYGLPGDLRVMDLGEYHPRWGGQLLYYRMENGRPEPYYSREEIDIEGKLAGRGLELAWARHPWDIYHLQVQGSGFLRLPDGSRKNILYAGKNGRQFVSVARLMLQRELIEPGNLHRSGIEAALDRLGPMRDGLLAENPSYVFFRFSDSPPVGSMGSPLTPMVSLATDPEFIPLGSVVSFCAGMPETPASPAELIQGIGLAQDTGGLIKGEHIDYYCGTGMRSEELAFRLKSPVAAYVLVSHLVMAE